MNNATKPTQQPKQKPGFWTHLAISLTIVAGALIPQLKAAEVPSYSSFTSEVIGQGKPIILIPGLMSDSRIWQQTVTALKADYQLHLINIAGFAGTPAISGALLLKVQSELLDYIKQQQLQKPAIIGHSLGAFMAFALASASPEQIGTVVAVDGLPYIAPIFTRNSATQVSDMQTQAEQLKRYYQALNGEQLNATAALGIAVQAREPVNQHIVLEMAKTSDGAAVGQALYELLTTDLRPTVHNIKSKVWLLGASGALPVEQQARAEALYQQQISTIANATLLFNTNSRHFMMLDEPAWFIAQLRLALQE